MSKKLNKSFSLTWFLMGIPLSFGLCLLVYLLVIPLFFSQSTDTFIPTSTSPNSYIPNVTTFDESTSSEYSIQNGDRNIESNVTITAIYSTFTSAFDRSLALYNLLANADDDIILKLLLEAQDPYTMELYTKTSVPSLEQDTDGYWLWKNQPRDYWNRPKVYLPANYDQQPIRVIFEKLLSQGNAKASAFYEKLADRFKRIVAFKLILAHLNEDLSSAVEFAKKSHPPRVKDEIIQLIISESEELSDKELIELGNSLGDQNYVKYILQERIREKDLANPAAAWETIKNQSIGPASDLFSRAESIVNNWVAQEGLSVLDIVRDSTVNEDIKHQLLRQAILVEARTNPEAAFEYSLAVESDSVFPMYENVLWTWTRSDPEGAWERVSSIHSETLRNELQSKVLQTWATYDATKALSFLEQIPEELQDRIRLGAIWSLTNQALDKAIAVITEITDSDIQQSAIGTLLSQWSYNDPEAAIEWIQTDPITETIRQNLLSTVLTNVSNYDPKIAFDLALKLPIGASKIGLEADVMSSVAFYNLTLAKDFLGRVRDGRTKLFAYEVVGEAMAVKGGFDEAINLGRELPATDREQYYIRLGTVVAGDYGGVDRTILSKIALLPSEVAQSRTAFTALTNTQGQNELSTEQVEQLEEYLISEDVEKLKEYRNRQNYQVFPFFQ